MREVVSIIVPVHNGEKTIVRCLKSIINQTYSAIEIIVVDDGSTDKTFLICQELKDRVEKMSVFSIPNSGVVEARKFGVKKATGKYIAFTDADDELLEDMIEKLVIRQKETQAEIVACGYRTVDEKNGNVQDEVREEIYILDRQKEVVQTFMQTGVLGFLWNKLFCRHLFVDEVWPIGIDVCEDLWMLCKMCSLEKNIKISYVAVPLYIYYLNETSVTHSYARKVTKERRWKYYEVYREIEEIFVNNEVKKVIVDARLTIIRLGIEELIGNLEYNDVKKNLKQCGRKEIRNLIKSRLSIKYKLGWLCKVLFA